MGSSPSTPAPQRSNYAQPVVTYAYGPGPGQRRGSQPAYQLNHQPMPVAHYGAPPPQGLPYPAAEPVPMWPHQTQPPPNPNPNPNPTMRPERPPPPRAGPQRVSSWTEARDRVYSRVLYAEEYLTRIQETNGQIQLISQLPNRHHYQSYVTEMLGLSGHLYGELVRIHHMLANDDPELKCLAEFEASHPAVVQKFRDIKTQSDHLKDASSSTDDDFRRTTISGGYGTDADPAHAGAATQVSGFGTTTSTGTDAGINGGVGGSRTSGGVDAQSGDHMERSDASTMFDENMTEEALKQKHAQEASHVAERFANVISGAHQLSVEEVNRVLGDHAAAVQRLRLKQDDEKQKFNEILRQRRRERAGLRNNKDGNEDDDHEKLQSSDHNDDDEMNEADDVIRELRSNRQAGSSTTNGETNGATNQQQPGLSDAVMQLEAMRLRGELTEDAVAGIVSKYLPSAAAKSRSRGNRAMDDDDMRESVSQMVQENLAKQKQLQTKRQLEKEQVDAKLKQKLLEKQQRQAQQSGTSQ